MLLLFATRRLEDFSDEEDRGGDRYGCQGAAKLFCNDAQFQIAEAEPAIFLGDRCAQKAHLAQTLPQGPVEGFRAFQNGAHGRGRALVRQITARLFLELLLFSRKFEIHLCVLT